MRSHSLPVLVFSIVLAACGEMHHDYSGHEMLQQPIKLVALQESEASDEYAEVRILKPASAAQKSSALIALGEKLFHDARLSGNMDVS